MSASLASLVAACGGNNSTLPPGGSGGSSGGNTSASSGSPSGGSSGNPGGGSSANPGGGSSANPGGGSSANPGGGSSANPGGSSGNPGGSTDNPGGRTGGAAGGASGGAATGGTTTPRSGGTTAGGAATGGSSAGGAVSAQPAVYVSNNGNCVSGTSTTWTPGTVTTSTGTATVNVTDTASQTWEGFGGCFNEKGWDYLQKLSSGDRDRAMQLLFGADGARFAIGRIPMGASDYAVARYTDDEGGADTSMANFNTTEDSKYLIPYIQAALAVKPDMKFWASPWTPPTWMKTGPFTAITDDSATTTSNFDSGNMADTAANLTAYAQYFVKFVNAYKAANINISMVAPQNEPNYALHYPSCLWTGALFTKFVGQYLGPALKDTGVGIMLGTLSNSDSGKDVDLATAVLADSTAKGFLKVAGVQWNVLDKVNGGTSIGGLPVWATEHKCGNYPWSGASGCGESSDSCPAYNSSKAPNDQAYGVESWKYIRNAIKKGKVTAYNAWNMVLDTVGNGLDTHRAWNQDALLTVDTSSKALNVTSAYCVFRHFSQFVDVGAKQITTSGGDAVAFKNPDGSYVVVMYNSGAASSSYVVSINNQKLQFSMPAAGWATVKYKP